MQLTPTAILIIRGFGPDEKEAFADTLGVSTKTLYRYLDSNDDNLTKAAGLQFLREKSGLTDAELLTGTELQN